MSVPGDIHRAAVLGSPVAHSLSPLIHNAGYRAAGLTDWRYDAHEVTEPELTTFVAGLGTEWAGLSLTMPLKRIALSVADEVTEVARTLGAGNTLLLRGGRRRVDNTDAPGMVDALARVGTTGAERVTVLGAGGTARGALYAAARLGARQVNVYARRPASLDGLREVADRLDLRLVGEDWTRPGAVGDADVVISTVPAGAADGLAGAVRWRPDATVFDVVYDPWPTLLAAAAAAHGARVLGGWDLLLAQAVRQFEQFTGIAAPTAAMRAALAAARPAAAVR